MKILIIDDEKELRDVVASYFVNEGFTVFKADDGVEAVKIFHDEHPDLVVLDLMLPDIPGEKVLSVIRERYKTPVIILSAKSSTEDRENGLKLGADEYLFKPFSPKEIVNKAKIILKKIGYKKDIDILELNGIIIDENLYQAKKKGVDLQLTPIEFKLLAVMANNPGRIYTREQLISFALGYKYEGINRTIDSHIKNLRNKIEENPAKPSIIKTVFGVGYKFGESL